MIRNFGEVAVDPSAYDGFGEGLRKDMGVYWAPLYVRAPGAKEPTKDVDRPFFWGQSKALEAPPPHTPEKKEAQLFTPPELNKKNPEEKLVPQKEQEEIKKKAT